MPDLPRWSCYSGTEPLVVRPTTNFILVGERTNITGSKRFARLIKEGNFEAAVKVAREQVQNGANILDVNMDADLIDGKEAMARFLNLLANEPVLAKVPIMVDSSKWEIIEEGLRHLQGKGIVNSISLKEGEDVFRERAATVWSRSPLKPPKPSGRPALGWQLTCVRQMPDRVSTCGRIRSTPTAQLRPTLRASKCDTEM